ncbi:MAG: heat-inducible transcription repressor HrcA, partial [Armatimonadetes bacterium]|nr:heat-inducible transcription repressor HrcA [Armatimonadota bacterium]
RYALGVKSATLRSEMAEMSDLGYLRQPHTSAGRVPSDRGYRFYVGKLMVPAPIAPDETARIRVAVRSASSELDAVIRKTCVLLTAMTRLPAIATAPNAQDTRIKQVFVSPASENQVLLVILFSTGHTETRLLSGVAVSASDALTLANALNERLVNRELSAPQSGDAPPQIAHLSKPFAKLLTEIGAATRALTENAPLFVEGTQTVWEHPEFKDVEKLSGFLTLLQERAALLEVLTQSLATESETPHPVRYAIGQEIGHASGEYSMVSAPYRIGNTHRGSIGVFGPTRMDYARASSAVELMAQTMSDFLTRLSVAP